MKRTAIVPTLILALLFSMVTMTLQAGYCLSPDFHVYGTTAIYDSYGRSLNITLAPDLPRTEPYNKTLASFTLKILSEILTPGGGMINGNQYLVKSSQAGFRDCYLLSGFVLDYDRGRAIGALWTNWGNWSNEIYVKEKEELSQHSCDAILSQSADSYHGYAILPELTDGVHNMTVWVRAHQDYLSTYYSLWAAFSETITFKVDTIAPRILVLTPQKSTYKTSEVPLNFTVNERFSKIEYSLNGQNNVTISENITLVGLPNGYHNVTVYATDEAGNTGASETLYFLTDAPEPFPLSVAAASIAAVVGVGAGLLAYFTKRRREAGQK